MKLNEIPVEQFNYSICDVLYRGYLDRFHGVYHIDDNGDENKLTPTEEEIEEFLSKFEQVQDTILDPLVYYETRQVIFLHKETGQHWALEFSADSWEDDGNFGEKFEWYQVTEAERVIKIFIRK